VKFASLGSGSEGNALLISTREGATSTTVMLDCGFAVRETERRLARFGMTPADLAGIVVTHEHSDHVGGVFKLARKYRLPVWISSGTFQAVQRDADGVDVRFCADGDRLAIGDLELRPYTVPHDAREPLQYVAADGARTLGVLTDAGHATPHMVAALAGCDGLLLECNHDLDMLANSTYPAFLRRRIGGDYGHLANVAATGILREVDQSRLGIIVGAHLSRQNNTPELAREALLAGLASTSTEVRIACQDAGFDWIALG